MISLFFEHCKSCNVYIVLPLLDDCWWWSSLYKKSFQSSIVSFSMLLHLHRSWMMQTCESGGHVSWCSALSSELSHLHKVKSLWKSVDCCTLIFLSRKSAGYSILVTDLHPLNRRWPLFKFSGRHLTSSRAKFLLVGNQAEIIILMRLIQRRNNVTKVRIKLRSCDCGRQIKCLFVKKSNA